MPVLHFKIYIVLYLTFFKKSILFWLFFPFLEHDSEFFIYIYIYMILAFNSPLDHFVGRRRRRGKRCCIR